MKPQRVVLGAFLFALLPLLGLARQAPVPAAPQQVPPVVKEIDVKATKYEFAPNKIEVELNTELRLKITADDNKHGFEIEGVKDSKGEIPKGTTRVVVYKADKAGTFKFKCSSFCGLGHGRMSGTIVVK